MGKQYWMQATPAQQLQELRRELDALKEEFRQFRKLVEFTPADPAQGTPATAKLKCASLLILGPDQAPQALLEGSPQGARLLLCNASGNPGIELAAAPCPSVTAFDAAGNAAAELAVEENSNRGRILIFDAGQPRAVLKATPDGGCVSVLHDDGRPRASLISTAHNGAELLMITPDLKPGVRLSSGATHGGLVTVHQANGKPAVTLISSTNNSGVVVSGKDGKQTFLP